MVKQRNLIGNGLLLTLKHWPALVWTYVFNLALAVLFSLPLKLQINAIAANSLASQRMVGAFDLGTIAGLFVKLNKGPGPAMMPGYFTTPIYLALYFFIVPGTLFCYQTGTSASLFAIFQSGFAYFWRFVRITLVSFLIFGPILGGLLALQKLWAAHIDVNTVGREATLLRLAGICVIGLVAAFLRVYFDLVEVYTIQLGLQVFPAGTGGKSKPERQIRRTFKTAWNTYRHNFFRAYPSFILLTLLGLSAVIVTARGAVHSLAQPRTWIIFLLLQLGLFLMLLTRFWQRGAETILALDNPLPPPPEPVAEEMDLPVAVPVEEPVEDDGSAEGDGPAEAPERWFEPLPGDEREP